MGDLAKIGNYWKVAVALTHFFGAARPLNAAELAESVPPPQAKLTSHPTGGTTPVIVSISLYVTDLIALDEANERFQLQGYLMAGWHDDRLVKDLTSGRKRTQHFRDDELWTPPFQMTNAIRYTRSAYVLDADDDGRVHYMERFEADVNNFFSLRQFPFDVQHLHVIVQPFLSETGALTFDPESPFTAVSREFYVELAAWRIDGVSFLASVIPAYGTAVELQQAHFDIKVIRRSGYYIWKVFLPMIVMVIVSWSVFWVDAKEFDWQMKIPIATMLSLIAFEFTISRDLPRVPYVTFLDAVFLTCFMFVFVCIVEIVAVYWLQKSGRRPLAERIHWNARWFVPVAYFSTLMLLVPFFFLGGGAR